MLLQSESESMLNFPLPHDPATSIRTRMVLRTAWLAVGRGMAVGERTNAATLDMLEHESAIQ